jgi:hypothetical protein
MTSSVMLRLRSSSSTAALGASKKTMKYEPSSWPAMG